MAPVPDNCPHDAEHRDGSAYRDHQDVHRAVGGKGASSRQDRLAQDVLQVGPGVGNDLLR